MLHTREVDVDISLCHLSPDLVNSPPPLPTSLECNLGSVQRK